MEWQEVPEHVDLWKERLTVPTQLAKQATANVFTSGDVGYYAHPDTLEYAIFNEGTRQDGALCKAALARMHDDIPLRASPFLSRQELEDPACRWVKVAFSATLNQAMKYLNFFPGQYPGGIPNAPSPLASMLTSGAVGAGLGWGVGTLAGKLLPEEYGENMGRTGAILGGLAGAVPGATWGLANHMSGKSVVDPSPFNSPDKNPVDPWTASAPKQANDAALSEWYKAASIKVADSFGGYAPQRAPSPADVNINALGQTLWDGGAGTALTASTLGAMYAAQMFPDPNARQGYVTGGQLSQFTGNTVGDFATGYLAGVLLNKAIGSPVHPATIGLISAVVPKLFGR